MLCVGKIIHPFLESSPAFIVKSAGEDVDFVLPYLDFLAVVVSAVRTRVSHLLRPLEHFYVLHAAPWYLENIAYILVVGTKRPSGCDTNIALCFLD